MDRTPFPKNQCIVCMTSGIEWTGHHSVLWARNTRNIPMTVNFKYNAGVSKNHNKIVKMKANQGWTKITKYYTSYSVADAYSENKS